MDGGDTTLMASLSASPARLTEADRKPCTDLAREMRSSALPPEISHDALEFLIEGYARLVEGLLDPRASASGIAAIVAQQFEIADQIARHDLMPIVEPEVSIKAADKGRAEAILLAEISRRLDALPEGRQVMLKLTIPDEADLYEPLVRHPKVARVVALSGGYPLDDACTRLAKNHGMIASFSRALIDDLKHGMSDADFDATLSRVIDKIYRAS